MSAEKKITETYFHGVNVAVATQVGVTSKYVSDVLSGKYDGDHFTEKRKKTVQKIKEAAEPFKKATAITE
jgi:hypothetical protein